MPNSATVMQRDEAERVKALLDYEILDTLPDPAFDEIARLAASICVAPYAFIGFVDWSRVWFKSRVGFSARQMARPQSACQFVVMEGRPILIGDASEDHRFPECGLALAENLYCRSYAAAPLISPEGAAVGVLAVCSTDPHAFGRATLEPLQILARQAMTRLELYANSGEREKAQRIRQQAERALTVERNFVSAILDTISALVLVLDTAGRIIRFNRASEFVSGYSSAEVAGQAFPEELFPEGERERAIVMFEKALAGTLDEGREIGWRSKQGELRRISWTTTSLKNSQDEVSFVILTGVDVTAQREAEDALKVSEARYRQLIESSLGLVCTHDLEGVVLSINPHAAALLGYEPEEMTGKLLRDYIDEAHQAAYDTYFDEVRRNYEAQGLFYMKRRDGGVTIFAYHNKLLELPNAAPFVLAHGIDITEQTQSQERLHALMLQHESILESVGDGILGVDMEGRLTFVNRSAAEMLGYAAEEIAGQNAHALLQHSRRDGSPYPEEESPIFASLKGGAPLHVHDDLLWRKNGASFPVEYVARPLVQNDRVTGTVVAFRDVTERKRLDRMKDEFISTVSHELRTPLTSLRAALGLVAAGALEKRPEKIPEMLDIAMGNCDRLVRLVNDIVDFEHIGSGNLKLEKTEWDVFDLLRRAIEHERSSAKRAGLHFRIDAQPAAVWADGERILQVLGNLIRNAIKFSEKGGEIRLRASITSETEVTFEVQDQGTGIPPEQLKIIFDRFQQGDSSDVRANGGTGLGLAICRSIIEQHGGRIWATSSLGEGSIFHFTVERFAEPENPEKNS